MDIAEIGSRIENRRISLGLKQEDVSEMSGITVRTLYKIEQGKGNPAFDTLNKLCEVLGLEIKVDIRKTSE